MENRWQFEQGEDSRWRWAHTTEDSERVESRLGFERATDCMLDAVRYVIARRRASLENAQ
jgi:hypothetical protein